ncbi:MAG TPA: glycosyltransferase family 4 protein [Microlunatus sp.]|nr:glycosyltransferase family 4 protein [Microlunatus sp.]
MSAVPDDGPATNGRSVVVVNPSLDAYGSDLQMLESVTAFRNTGWGVTVVVPGTSSLRDRLFAVGASVVELDFPVLRRADAQNPVALIKRVLTALPTMVRLLRRAQPDVLYVSTVTLPWWLLAGRLAGVPTICHAHEAEARDSRRRRRALALPLLLCQRVVVNSRTTQDTFTDVLPRLGSRMRLVYNGVPSPPHDPERPHFTTPTKLVVIGRLSPRKAPSVAIETVSLLRKSGRDVRLELCGTPAAGMEWYQEELESRCADPELAGSVTFSGYASPIWTALERADIVLAPSLGESFGNAVVEAQMAKRPVVATALQGHLETVDDGHTGLLVPSEDAEAMAAAVADLIDDHELASRLAEQGHQSAVDRFSRERYHAEISSVLAG